VQPVSIVPTVSVVDAMRAADETITVGDKSPYISRWVIRRVSGVQVALHKTDRSDDDRARHDHVGWNISIVLRGGYWEHLSDGVVKWRGPGSIIFRRATTLHRLELPLKNGEYQTSWSLWIRGPFRKSKRREWGFMTKEHGWLRSDIYLDMYGPAPNSKRKKQASRSGKVVFQPPM